MKPTFLRLWSVTLIFLIWGIHTLASFFYWYDIFPWFDKFMHFSGGFWLAISFLWVTHTYIPEREPPFKKYSFIILLVLIVSLLWEIYEFGVQGLVSVTTLANLPDSRSDLFFDLLGGTVGYLLAIKNNKIL
jgi:hypothetical protein